MSETEKCNEKEPPKASQSEDPANCAKVCADSESGSQGTKDKEKTGLLDKFKQGKDKGDMCSEEGNSKDDAPKKKYTLKERLKDIKDGFAEISKNRKDKKRETCKATGAGGARGGGRMIYPYTLTAKIVQFPYKYYYNHVWLFKYFWIGSAVSFPLFMYIGHKSYSKENVDKWRKIREEAFGLRSH